MKKILLCMCLIGMFCIPKIYAGYGTGNDVSGSSVAVSNFYQVIPHIVDISTNIVNATDRITINNSTNTSRSNELIVNISTNIERADVLIVDVSSNIQNLKETNKTYLVDISTNIQNFKSNNEKFLVDIATNTQKVDSDINKLNQDVTVNASTNTALVYNELQTKFYNPDSTMTIVNTSIPLNSGNTVYMTNPNMPLNPGNTVYITNTDFITYVNTVTVVNPFIPLNPDNTTYITNTSMPLNSGNTIYMTNSEMPINSGSTVTVVNFTSTVTITNPSLNEFDLLSSSVIKIMANESNGITSFSPGISIKQISILSEGGYNSVTTNNCGYYNDIPDGMPDNIPLPRIVTGTTFSWALTPGTTLHIQVVGGN